jgi:anti-sigma factor RsiW
MAHEIDKEQLTAYMDGELPATERDEVKEHLGKCPTCLGYLGTIAKAREDFKKFGAEKAPAALLARALRLAAGKKARMGEARPLLRLVLALTAMIALLMAGSLLAKKFMPGLFSQIQGMISGAENHLGQ